MGPDREVVDIVRNVLIRSQYGNDVIQSRVPVENLDFGLYIIDVARKAHNCGCDVVLVGRIRSYGGNVGVGFGIDVKR